MARADNSHEGTRPALEARLASIEEELTRLIRLASTEKDVASQEQYWALAKDLQREARELRRHIANSSS